MFATTFEGGNLKITMEEALKRNVSQYGVNHQEIYRLVESFANSLLASQKSDKFFLSNEDTGANLELDVKWESETDVLVQITAVNLANVKLPEKPNLPKGVKVNLAHHKEFN